MMLGESDISLESTDERGKKWKRKSRLRRRKTAKITRRRNEKLVLGNRVPSRRWPCQTVRSFSSEIRFARLGSVVIIADLSINKFLVLKSVVGSYLIYREYLLKIYFEENKFLFNLWKNGFDFLPFPIRNFGLIRIGRTPFNISLFNVYLCNFVIDRWIVSANIWVIFMFIPIKVMLV